MASWGRSGGLRGTTGGVSRNLRRAGRVSYLVHDILERVGAVNGEAHKDDVRLRVRKWPQTVVLFLSGSVPEGKLDHLPCRRVGCVGDVVLEDGGHIFLVIISRMRLWSSAARTSGKLPEL